MSRVFADRREAGRELGRRVAEAVRGDDVIILGLPRGGVPVAFEVAAALEAPLDVFLVRKLGVPGHEELAMGAIASGGVRVVNESVVQGTGVSQDEIDGVARRELAELERREQLYRDGRRAPDVAGRTVVVVDDGLATGSTMQAAVAALQRLGAGHLVVAVPVASPATCAHFEQQADAVVCVETPERFSAVGLRYDDFSPTEDDEVCALLREARSRRPQPDRSAPETTPRGG
ncbi:MAG: phosphoribosyltransferase [Solirubrobacterales bacterium]|nr:phosphoribosyltransferase [Solirubrobacterales bacterium]